MFGTGGPVRPRLSPRATRAPNGPAPALTRSGGPLVTPLSTNRYQGVDESTLPETHTCTHELSLRMVTAWRPVAPRGEDRPRWPPWLPAPCDACRQPTGSPRQRLPPSSRAKPRALPCLLPCLASAQAPARLPLARAAGRPSAARARAYPRRLPQGLTRAAPAGAHALLPHPSYVTHGIGHDACRPHPAARKRLARDSLA